MLYDFSRYMRNREKPAEKKNKPEIEMPQGLPAGLADKYGLAPLSCESQEKGWELVCQEGRYLVRELKAVNSKAAEIFCRWDRLHKEGCPGVPVLLKTKEDQSFAAEENRLFFLIKRPQGEEFSADNPEHLLACARVLGNIHELTGKWQLTGQADTGRSWVHRIQDRLTELLTVNKYLRKRRALNDFENLFLESFDFLYDQGQEAVQHMALFITDDDGALTNCLLINSFAKREILINGKQAIFLDLSRSRPGVKTQDLARFLSAYLPVHNWEPEVLSQVLQAYQEKGSLNEPEKHLLQSLLRFPTRFWLLTYWYLESDRSTSFLEEQLKKYVRECAMRDKCLDSLDSLFWGE